MARDDKYQAKPVTGHPTADIDMPDEPPEFDPTWNENENKVRKPLVITMQEALRLKRERESGL